MVGERLWQVRWLDGINAEWITERDYLNSVGSVTLNTHKLSDRDKDVQRMEYLEPVLVCFNLFLRLRL